MTNWTCAEVTGAANQWLGNNIPRFCEPAYDALVAQMGQTASLGERAALARRMNDMLMQSHVMIPLVHRGDVSAHASGLLGVRMNSWDSELWNVSEWERVLQ